MRARIRSRSKGRIIEEALKQMKNATTSCLRHGGSGATRREMKNGSKGKARAGLSRVGSGSKAITLF